MKACECTQEHLFFEQKLFIFIAKYLHKTGHKYTYVLTYRYIATLNLGNLKWKLGHKFPNECKGLSMKTSQKTINKI